MRLVSLCALVFFAWLAHAKDGGEITAATCLELAHVGNTTKNICEKNEKSFLLLEFFSTRCSFCRRNVPLFRRLEDATAAHAHSRLISLNTQADAEQFKNEFDIATDIAIDGGREAQNAYGVTHVPTLFVLNDKNEIVFKYVGVLTDAVIDRVKRLVISSAATGDLRRSL